MRISPFDRRNNPHIVLKHGGHGVAVVSERTKALQFFGSFGLLSRPLFVGIIEIPDLH